MFCKDLTSAGLKGIMIDHSNQGAFAMVVVVVILENVEIRPSVHTLPPQVLRAIELPSNRLIRK
jgi:hypothetical protein